MNVPMWVQLLKPLKSQDSVVEMKGGAKGDCMAWKQPALIFRKIDLLLGS